MKNIWVGVAGLLAGLLMGIGWGEAAPIHPCRSVCVEHARQTQQWCAMQHRNRVMLCRKWSVARYQVCSQQGVQARLAFCEAVYGERIAQCVRWLQVRRLRCQERQQTCLKPSLVTCRRWCEGTKEKPSCLLSCQRPHIPACLAEFRACEKDTQDWEKRCVAHARYRKQQCTAGIAGTTPSCRAYGNRAAAICFSEAGGKLRQCQQSTLARQKACLSRCG